MKKRIFIFVLSLIPLLSLGQNVCVDSLLQKIDSIRSTCEKLKDKEKVKGYEQALILQDSVYNLMADSIRYFSSFEKDAHAYKYFVCNDATIFSRNYIETDTRRLPKFMQERHTAITAIRQFANCIESMESKIKSAEADKDITDTDKKTYVAIKIKSEIDRANELLDRIDKVNMSTFSDEQTKYYQGLSERLTNILNKYIF